MNKIPHHIYKDSEFASYWHKRAGEDGEPYKRYLLDPIMFALAGELTGKAVLELGCGNGYRAKQFLKRGAASVLGVDISMPVLEIAKACYQSEKVCFRKLDATKTWDLKKSSVDLIFSTMMFNQVKNIRRPFLESMRVLKRQGVLIFSVTHPAWDLYVYAQEKAGQKQTKIRGLKGYFERGFATYMMGSHSQTAPHLAEEYGREFAVPHYHHTLQDYFSALIDAGFSISHILEPPLNNNLLKRHPEFSVYQDHPISLVFRCQKKR